jgi:hypothetical protein
MLDGFLALPKPLPQLRVANPVRLLLAAVLVLEAGVDGLQSRLLLGVKRLEQL